MSSYFKLNLDTTPPTVTVYAPNYTVPYENVSIIIKANENLSPNNEIYIIDSNGERFDLTFELSGSILTGMFNFAGCSIGIATIYAIVQDTVLNISSIFSKAINIIESAELFLTLAEKQQEVSILNEQINSILVIENYHKITCYEEIIMEDESDG